MFKLSPLKERVELGTLLRDKGLLGHAVEVGVHRGDFAEPFLQLWNGNKLFLIDPWAKLDNYDDIRNKLFNPRDYHKVKGRFLKYGNRVVFLRKLSHKAVEDFEDESLDFVYIDANHSYEHTKQDLEIWWPKIIKGGILAGHDIISQFRTEPNPTVPGFETVTRAVSEFSSNIGLDVFVVDEDVIEGKKVIADSYYMVKP